jgi:hypothetical protein
LAELLIGQLRPFRPLFADDFFLKMLFCAEFLFLTPARRHQTQSKQLVLLSEEMSGIADQKSRSRDHRAAHNA